MVRGGGGEHGGAPGPSRARRRGRRPGRWRHSSRQAVHAVGEVDRVVWPPRRWRRAARSPAELDIRQGGLSGAPAVEANRPRPRPRSEAPASGGPAGERAEPRTLASRRGIPPPPRRRARRRSRSPPGCGRWPAHRHGDEAEEDATHGRVPLPRWLRVVRLHHLSGSETVRTVISTDRGDPTTKQTAATMMAWLMPAGAARPGRVRSAAP